MGIEPLCYLLLIGRAKHDSGCSATLHSCCDKVPGADVGFGLGYPFPGNIGTTQLVGDTRAIFRTSARISPAAGSWISSWFLDKSWEEFKISTLESTCLICWFYPCFHESINNLSKWWLLLDVQGIMWPSLQQPPLWKILIIRSHQHVASFRVKILTECLEWHWWGSFVDFKFRQVSTTSSVAIPRPVWHYKGDFLRMVLWTWRPSHKKRNEPILVIPWNPLDAATYWKQDCGILQTDVIFRTRFYQLMDPHPSFQRALTTDI